MNGSCEHGGSENGQVRFATKKLWEITPSAENDELYRPIDPDDEEIRLLALSIQKHGLREPIVVTLDGYILSGHRRHVACKLCGLDEVPVRVEPIYRTDDRDQFIVLLREYNRQRDKTSAEKLREEMVGISPDEAWETLLEHRQQQAYVDVRTMPLKSKKKRSRITAAKRPMLEKVKQVLEDLRPYWPVGERKVHYKLLNDPPLRHASKSARYENTPQCCKDLSNLITRARLIGEIPWEAIGDETRPYTAWNVHNSPRSFLRSELTGMFRGYYRNLQQSQPNYIHLHVEKNTVYSILRDVVSQYCLPISSGRGFSCHDRIHAIAESYRRSGKDQLILIVASDFDPSGDCIAESFCRSLRDDYGINRIMPIKAALTHEQVTQMDLPKSVELKESDSRYKDFVKRYGADVEAYELEAVDETTLRQFVIEVIDSVMDFDAFRQEQDAERKDAAFLEGIRRQVHNSLEGIDWEDDV